MKRSKFSLSHFKLLSTKMGHLVPIGAYEVLPGDTIQHATNALVRCSPLLAPVMHPVRVRIHHWFVPNRLIWDEWEDFITGGPDGTFAPVAPVIASPATTGFAVGSLGDHLGVPPGDNAIEVSALPFRAYNLIWNEHYRDQDLQLEQPISTASGVDTTTNINLLRCAWEKDYFTSARPWEQKGPAVTIPLGASPVANIAAFGQLYLSETAGGTNRPVASTTADLFATGAPTSAAMYYKQGLVGTIPASSMGTINDLREAFALQRYEEARARYGSRYSEYLRYLGVRSSDARLARPEYLGGGKQVIQFSEVLQTSPSADGGTPIATMAGHGISAMRSNRFRRFFEEHGIVISLMSVLPKTMYMQSTPKMFTRGTKERYWQKELQHIGQAEILNLEVRASHATPLGTFGFQDRYDEYRREESRVSGEFRTTLNHWHMARDFATDPALNAAFIEAQPTTRIFADTASDHLYVMANHSIQARRMVAKSGFSAVK